MNHQGTRTLQTNRLILRKVTLNDIESIYKYASNENVTRYMVWSAHKDIEETTALVTKWIQKYQEPDFYQWGIALKETNEVIGFIGCPRYDDKVESIEFGYWIGEKFWRNGIMPEALKEVVKFLFEEVNVNVIRSCHVPENPASGKVMQKANMVYEGTLRKNVKLSNGKIEDGVTYSILKEEYFNSY